MRYVGGVWGQVSPLQYGWGSAGACDPLPDFFCNFHSITVNQCLFQQFNRRQAKEWALQCCLKTLKSPRVVSSSRTLNKVSTATKPCNILYIVIKSDLSRRKHIRFFDFFSWTGKDSSIYCLTLWSTVFASRRWSLGTGTPSAVWMVFGRGLWPLTIIFFVISILVYFTYVF